MATRYRLTASTTAPDISPALQSYSHTQTTRRQLLRTDASALTTSAYAPDGADHLVAGDAHHIQFVADQMPAGVVFTNGDVIKTCIQGLEANAGNNLRLQLFVAVVSADGATVRRILRSKIVGGIAEFGTTLLSSFLSTTQDGATYTSAAGDRLLVEVSVSGTPSAATQVQGHNASLRWGGNGAGGDLLENNTQSGTTLNPWIEFMPTIGDYFSGTGATGADAVSSGSASEQFSASGDDLAVAVSNGSGSVGGGGPPGPITGSAAALAVAVSDGSAAKIHIGIGLSGSVAYAGGAQVEQFTGTGSSLAIARAGGTQAGQFTGTADNLGVGISESYGAVTVTPQPSGGGGATRGSRMPYETQIISIWASGRLTNEELVRLLRL